MTACAPYEPAWPKPSPSPWSAATPAGADRGPVSASSVAGAFCPSAARIARLSASDFETFHLCAIRSSTCIVSTSRAYVDRIVVMAIPASYGHTRAGRKPLARRPGRARRRAARAQDPGRARRRRPSNERTALCGVSACVRYYADVKVYTFEIVIEKEEEDEGYLAYSPTPAGCFSNRSEERRVGKECRSRWSPY